MVSATRRDDWPTAIGRWATAADGAGTSPATVRLRCWYLSTFAAWVGRGPWAVTADEVSEWLARPQWGPEARKSARASLRVFYRWAIRTGRTKVDPTAATDGVRVPAGAPRPVPEAVLARALAAATPRVRLMLLLAAYGGLRRAEIAGLHYRDLVDGGMRITGKGRKVRWVPMHSLIAAELAQHQTGDRGGYVFPGRDDGHLSALHVGKQMSAALGPGWSAHTLRHRFGTRLYAGSRDLLQVQALLGHSSPATTQRYVAVPDDGMRAAVDAIA